VLTDITSKLSGTYSVAVLTSRKLLADPNAGLEARGAFGDVVIFRVWTSRLGRASLWRRAVDFLSFHLSVCFFLLRNIRKGDLVVFKTDPPLLQLVNTSIVRIKGGVVINWLQDLYPEIAQRLGSMPGPQWLSRPLATWRDRALQAAAANVVISPRMAAYLEQRGVINVQVISNWADENTIRPMAHENNPLRVEWGLSGKFTVMYSGNFGRVHAFEEIADAMRHLAGEPNIYFVLIGEGAGLDTLQQLVQKTGINNVSFKPYQPKELLHYSLGAADLHLVSLKAGMEDLVMPSKLYGILAAGRPVAFIGEQDSDIGRLLHREQVGFAVTQADGDGLAQQILTLARDPKRQIQYQSNARALFEREFTLYLGLERWQGLLEKVSTLA